MIEFFKILIEEPEKLKKSGLFIIKIILNMIFAAKLYVWMFGSYSLINFADFSAWVNFIMNGTVLICILLLITSEILLFQLLSVVSAIPLVWLAEKLYSGQPDRTINHIIGWLLKTGNVIALDEKTKKVSAGKNTEQFYEFVSSFEEKESKKEIATLKNSLVNEILHTYFVFVVIYFFVIEFPHSKTLTSIVVAGAVILPGFYLEVCWVIEYMNKNAKNLLYELRGLKFEQRIYEILRDIGIYPMDVDNPKEKGYLKYIFHKKKEYILYFNARIPKIILFIIFT